eukprot:g12300.t1
MGDTAAQAQLQDPFYLAKDDVNTQLATLRSLHNEWETMRNNTRGQVSSEFDNYSVEFLDHIKNCQFDAQDMEGSVRIVQENRARFSISDEE